MVRCFKTGPPVLAQNLVGLGEPVTHRAVCEALSVGRLLSVWLPPDVIEVQVFGDNGERGHEGAEKARKTFNEQGRRVVLRFPPEPFGDWNDFLQGQKTGPAA